MTEFKLGDVVRLKKVHPCGGSDWEVDRIGADIGIRCQNCRRRLVLARSALEKRMKGIIPTEV